MATWPVPEAPGQPLRVLLVDDSVVARKLIGDALGGCPEIASLVTAPSGPIALQKAALEPPDVAILDLEMPDMDGIAVLRELKARLPAVRVLIFTGNGELARTRAVQALTEGASDVLLKPVLAAAPYPDQVAAMRAHLLPKVRQFAPAARPAGVAPASRMAAAGVRPRALVIGVSTGGPEALSRLLPALPATFPLPVLVVQHMPPGFTAALAARLDRLCALAVAEASDGEPVVPGRVYIAPAGHHLAIGPGDPGEVVRVTDDPPENSCRPAVDVLLRTAADAFGGRLLVAILTGMGSDGLAGTRLCKARGARVLAQDAASSVVWGMPGAVVEAGLADAVLPLEAMPAWLIALAQGRTPPCPR